MSTSASLPPDPEVVWMRAVEFDSVMEAIKKDHDVDMPDRVRAPEFIFGAFSESPRAQWPRGRVVFRSPQPEPGWLPTWFRAWRFRLRALHEYGHQLRLAHPRTGSLAFAWDLMGYGLRIGDASNVRGRGGATWLRTTGLDRRTPP